MLTLIYYDIITQLRRSQDWLNPLLFFFIIITLFAVGLNDRETLPGMSTAIIWISILLAHLLSIDRLFLPLLQEGSLDQLIMCQKPLVKIVIAKLISHWLVYSMPFLILSPIAAVLLGLPFIQIPLLLLTIFLGTPVLVCISAIAAGLTLGIKQSGLLIPLIVLPFYFPVLLLSTSIMTSIHQTEACCALLLALTLLTFSFAPFTIAASLRLGVENSCTS